MMRPPESWSRAVLRRLRPGVFIAPIVMEVTVIEPPAPGDDGLPAPSHARPSAWPQARVFAVITAAAVLLVGVVAGGIVLSEPSYPHSWCGPVLAEMHARSGTQGGYEAAMARIHRQDHAPVGRLLTDLYAYDAAHAAAEDGNNFTALGNLGGAMSALRVVGGDLKVIGRECGQPKGAYEHYTF